jgi:CRISPR-associated protein Cmr2
VKYLIAVAIGPVQEFIASARRSRDLWFGSWLLSELSKAAAHAIVEQPECNLDSLIFPRITNAKDLKPGSDFNVVNKLLALIEVGDPASFGKQIKDAVDDRLRTIRSQAWRQVDNDPHFQRETAKLQVEDLNEFFWAAVPLDDPKNYKAARDRAEALLAARKTTRDFHGVSWGQPGVPKSSLDGQRESVIHEDVYDAVRQGVITEEELRRRFQVRLGERLCGVGLLKRLGRRYDNDSFFSTSHVAALPLLERLKHETQRAAVLEYLGKLREYGMDEQRDLNQVPLPPSGSAHPIYGRRDGHLLFEERLREYFPPKEKPNAKKQAETALRHLLRTAFDDQKPIPYYALLLADGDRMGKAIDAITEIGRHRALSQRLSEFAGSVRAIVENRPDETAPVVQGHQGSLVYAGGDDVLAFVPLHRVLDCARNLADEFRKKLEKFNDAGDPPTLSVGIAIAHHLDPLSDALELARAAEKAAKSVPGKDALCIKVSKRGGSTTTVQGKWGKLDERLRWFIELHCADDVPDGAAYELHRLAEDFRHFSPENKKQATPLEVNRILKRKRARHGEQDLAAEVREIVVAELETELATDADGKRNPLQQLADELIVARLLADAAEQAAPKAEPKTNGEEQP